MGFGYLSAAIIALIVLLAFRKYTGQKEPAADGRGGPPGCAFRGESAASGGNGAARAV